MQPSECSERLEPQEAQGRLLISSALPVGTPTLLQQLPSPPRITLLTSKEGPSGGGSLESWYFFRRGGGISWHREASVEFGIKNNTSDFLSTESVGIDARIPIPQISVVHTKHLNIFSWTNSCDLRNCVVLELGWQRWGNSKHILYQHYIACGHLTWYACEYGLASGDSWRLSVNRSKCEDQHGVDPIFRR